MRLPAARGPVSAAVVDALGSALGDSRSASALVDVAGGSVSQGREDHEDHEDALLALWVLPELSYRGFDGVDEGWEWDLDLVTVRVGLEHDLERRLRARWAQAAPTTVDLDGLGVGDALVALVDDDQGPSLARHLHHDGTREQALELLRQRSVYHLKEADPTAWVVPRLTAQTKAALCGIQYDEYGAGDPTRLHHQLFADGLASAGLDAAYGGYVDQALPAVLEQNTALSMFGLHRRLRGAALGHFAAVESTSSLPSRQLAQALRRLEVSPQMEGYYTEHVEADAVHEQLAVRDVCGSLVEQEPHLRDDVLFGAWTYLDLEARTAASLLARWGVAA